MYCEWVGVSPAIAILASPPLGTAGRGEADWARFRGSDLRLSLTSVPKPQNGQTFLQITAPRDRIETRATSTDPQSIGSNLHHRFRFRFRFRSTRMVPAIVSEDALSRASPPCLKKQRQDKSLTCDSRLVTEREMANACSMHSGRRRNMRTDLLVSRILSTASET